MLRIELRGGREAERSLDLLRLPPGKRRTVMRTLGRMVRKNTKKRIQSQTTLSGSAMHARSPNGKKRGLMLKGLGRRMLVATDANSATVKWRSGRVAAKHQHGGTEHMTPARVANWEGEGSTGPTAPSTRKQAKKLLELGYKIRRGKGWKRPTVKWINENLKRGHAGRIIRILSSETPKQSWDITLPARPFLGVTAVENRELQNTIADILLNA